MPAIRKHPPKNAAEEIRALAATGFSLVGISAHFGIGLSLLNRWLEEHQALSEALSQGREQERQALHNVLYKLAVEGNDKVAAMFLLKARHGYREGDQSEQANRVSVVFNIPGALTPEQYKVIDGNGSNTDNRAKQLPATTTSRS